MASGHLDVALYVTEQSFAFKIGISVSSTGYTETIWDILWFG